MTHLAFKINKIVDKLLSLLPVIDDVRFDFTHLNVDKLCSAVAIVSMIAIIAAMISLTLF